MEPEWSFDYGAECGAIGAVLVAPRDVSRKLLGGAMPRDFHDYTNRWMWKELWSAGRVIDTTIGVKRWLRTIAVRLRSFDDPRRLFGQWLNAGFWWHGWWYLDRIKQAATLRRRTIAAGAAYEQAIIKMRAWK